MDSDDDIMGFEPMKRCERACRLVESLHRNEACPELATIFRQGAVNKGVAINDLQSTSEIKECDCSDAHCELPKADWNWAHAFEFANVKVLGTTAIFHPNYAYGTAAVRGEKALTGSTIAYWEVQNVDIFFGTSIMFGVGTLEATLSAGYRFMDLLGFDENSYGLNHHGMAWHNGYSFRCCDPIPQTGRGRTVSILFNGPERKMSFFVDHQYVGTPFLNINTSRPLYPMVASTAQQSEFRLKNQILWSTPQSLYRIAIQQIHRQASSFKSLPLPRGLIQDLRVYGAKIPPRPNDSKILNQIPPHGRKKRIALDHRSTLVSA